MLIAGHVREKEKKITTQPEPTNAKKFDASSCFLTNILLRFEMVLSMHFYAAFLIDKFSIIKNALVNYHTIFTYG